MRAVVLVDELQFDCDDPHFTKRQPRRPFEAEYYVTEALRSLGHEVTCVPAIADITGMIQQIQTARPDFVFNLVEEIAGRREYDSLIAQLLELMNIPYTGASPDALVLARNKYLAKLVVADVGVLAPKGIVVTPDTKISKGDLKFPVIVKPMYLDGSDGVTTKSYVKDLATLRRRVSTLMLSSPQSLLCEEYAPGREIIVTISGTKNPTVDSICELVFTKNSPVKFATQQAKFDGQYRKRYGMYYATPTHLPPSVEAKVIADSKTAYRALRIEAYAKLEFRVDGEKVVFIEANPNSQMNRFAKTTDFATIGYEKFIKKIVRMALNRRCGADW